MSETGLSTAATAYELQEQVAWIRLIRPERRNALGPDSISGVADGLDRAAADGARAIVLTGSGPAFCAGADLAHVLGDLSDLGAIGRLLEQASRLTLDMESHPAPIIAAVNGAAVAGGLELVLACDLVVAAESATFSDGHARFGLFPGAGASVRLPRLVGAHRARHLMFTAATLDAHEMKALGLVTEVVRGRRARAGRRRPGPQLAHGSPATLARMKRTIRAGLDLPMERALELELEEAREHLSCPDVVEGLTAFAERRAPQFQEPSR